MESDRWSNSAARLTSAPYMFSNRCADALKAIRENQHSRGTLNFGWNLGSNSGARLTSAPYMFSNRCADDLEAIREISLPEER